MMLLRCCTQYVSKPGKPSSGRRTGKGQPSSPFPRRAVLKNVQTAGQLYSFTMQVRLYSKSFKLGFSHYTNQGLPGVQMLGLEKGRRNQKSSCQHALDHRESKRVPEKHLPVSLTMLKPLTVWIINCGKLLKIWKYQTIFVS